jgi:hypothetical protein
MELENYLQNKKKKFQFYCVYVTVTIDQDFIKKKVPQAGLHIQHRKYFACQGKLHLAQCRTVTNTHEAYRKKLVNNFLVCCKTAAALWLWNGSDVDNIFRTKKDLNTTTSRYTQALRTSHCNLFKNRHPKAIQSSNQSNTSKRVPAYRGKSIVLKFTMSNSADMHILSLIRYFHCLTDKVNSETASACTYFHL